MNTTLILDTQELTQCFFEETRLFGIMAPVKAYQFCWQMNNLLGLDFRINHDIEIQLSRKQRNYFFSVFEFAEEHTSLVHYLYDNRFDGEYLLPEFRHLDFLWLLKGDEITDEAMEQLTGSVRAIKGVQLVVELTNEKIRNKEHLIF
jgi:hypothetical protein